MNAVPEVNTYVRSLEERAEREQALLDRLQPPSHSTPVVSSRGSRGSRGMASDKAFSRPGNSAQSRGNRGNAPPDTTAESAADTSNKPEPRPHFLRLDHTSDGLRPGVYWCDVTRDKGDGSITGQAAPVWICSPLTVSALTRDARGSEWGRLLVFPDRDGRMHRWTMPMRMLAGSGEELRGELLAEGLTITSSAKDRAKLSRIKSNKWHHTKL